MIKLGRLSVLWSCLHVLERVPVLLPSWGFGKVVGERDGQEGERLQGLVRPARRPVVPHHDRDLHAVWARDP